MTIDQQLPYFLVLFVVLGVGFPFFLVWLGYKATDNTLKRAYLEIGQKSPKLQAYLNQGYDLLAIVRDKGLIGVHVSVFNYPTKQALNKLPLFKVSFELLGTSQFHMKDCAESFSTEGYISWLPFHANRIYLEEARLSLARQLNIVFSKEKRDFLSVLFPKPKVGDVFKKETVVTLTGTAVPEGQTWQWQSNNLSVEDDKLVDVTNNNRVLIATFPPAGLIPGEVTYLVIHPEMPKHLVPAFVNLSILAGRAR
jgi:hypothetical protein